MNGRGGYGSSQGGFQSGGYSSSAGQSGPSWPSPTGGGYGSGSGGSQQVTHSTLQQHSIFGSPHYHAHTVGQPACPPPVTHYYDDDRPVVCCNVL